MVGMNTVRIQTLALPPGRVGCPHVVWMNTAQISCAAALPVQLLPAVHCSPPTRKFQPYMCHKGISKLQILTISVKFSEL